MQMRKINREKGYWEAILTRTREHAKTNLQAANKFMIFFFHVQAENKHHKWKIENVTGYFSSTLLTCYSQQAIFNISVNILNFACFVNSFWFFIPKRELDIRKTPANKEVCPESLRAMLEY